MKYALSLLSLTVFAFFSVDLNSWAEVKSSSASSQRPTISILSKVEVTAGMPVRLKDLGNVDFVSVEQAHQVLETVIFEAMDDAKIRQIKSMELIRLLKEKIGEISEQRWTYFIPEVVTISARKNALNEQALRREVLWALTEKCGDCSHIMIKDMKVPRVISKESLVDWQLDTDQLKLTGAFLLPLQVAFMAGRETYWLSGTVRAKKKGFVASRHIAQGQRITEQDLKQEDIDITFAKDGLPMKEEILGQMVMRNISVNQPIYRGDLKKELAVQRGQQITAVLGNDVFEVTTQVTAEEQGYIGDVIKIKAQEGKKTLSGQITEKGVVRIK